MGNNNFIAFLSHAGIHIFIFIFFSLILGMDKIIFGIVLFPAALYIDYKIGTFLKKQENLLNDFISVLSVPIVGLIIWFYCVKSYTTSQGGDLFFEPEVIWILNYIYNNFSVLPGYIFSELVDSFPLMGISLLISNFIPPIALIFGMHHKKEQDNIKHPETYIRKI